MRTSTNNKKHFMGNAVAVGALTILMSVSVAPARQVMKIANVSAEGGGSSMVVVQPEPVVVKAHDEIRQAARLDPVQSMRVIVSYSSESGDAELARLETLGGSDIQRMPRVNGYAVTLTAAAAGSLATDSGVLWVTPDGQLRASLDVGVPSMGSESDSPLRNDTPYRGAGVGVAILDSGVNPHPDLAGRIVATVDLSDYEGFDPRDAPLDESFEGFVSAGNTYDMNTIGEPDNQAVMMEQTTQSGSAPAPSPDPVVGPDLFGHGTHVAGIVAGDGSQSGGQFVGVAPEANIIDVKVLDDEGLGTVSNVIAGLEWVIDHKETYNIRVVVMSLGKPIFEKAELDPLVLATVRAWDAGIAVLTSAGNFGNNGHLTITSPGNAREIITVGSLTDWNTLVLGDDAVSTYSSRGPTFLDHVLKPDVIAPVNRIAP
ncbi:MAG: S8 family serine peptidase, partial [Acidobacteriota bacterium]|nr:S8 family serine peptidase [Acidobacteriota bacterium]